MTVTKPDSTVRREVWLVDARSKLLKELQTQKLDGTEYKTVQRLIVLDYNKPIEPTVFALDLPKDVMVIDQTTQDIGLVQGDLTDKDIAVKVVRTFLEAVIAGDYATAGRLYEGMPAAKIQEGLAGTKFVRIVSIAEPTLSPEHGARALQIPCEVEIEEAGVKSVRTYPHVLVRPVYNQADRWTIIGGI